jgi:hypothetical protein
VVSEGQEEEALLSRDQAAAAYSRPVLTKVIPFTTIYPAEKCHQKNQLKRHPAVRMALEKSGIEVRCYDRQFMLGARQCILLQNFYIYIYCQFKSKKRENILTE